MSGWVQDTVPAGSRRIRTSFGSVQVLASRWEAGERPAAGAPPGAGDLPSAGSSGAPAAGAPAAGWSDRVVVLVEVRNDSRDLVRVAPGQFRLRAGDAGPSVDFLRAEPHGGRVAPGRVLHLLLTFAVSPESTTFGLEYWEAGADAPLVAAPAARVEVHPGL